jgi:hypothetical protein
MLVESHLASLSLGRGTKAREGPAFRLGSSGTRTMRKLRVFQKEEGKPPADRSR